MANPGGNRAPGRARFTTFGLAEPYAVLVGDPSIADRFSLRPQITDEELEAYARRRVESRAAPEVENR